MKRFIKLIIQLIVFAIVFAALYLAVIIVWGTLTDYRPDEITELKIGGNALPGELTDSTFTLLSWNIGFCGLGAEMDFFYDGGKMVRPTKQLTEKYTNGILKYLQSVDSLDFILLQEADKNSARTNKQDEIEMIQAALPKHASSFGTNYNVQFVPLPFTNPLGKVEMGQLNLSKYKPESSQRYSFFSAYAWPKRLFMLDRCFVISLFKLDNGKDIVLMNTHSSAYDAGGKLREAEMPIIRDLMIEEYKKGNYVVAGGDWNQNPPDYDLDEVDKKYPAVLREKLDASLFPSDWQVVYDPENPTNREIDAPLQKNKTEVTIIDYYILSPNIHVEQIKTFSQNFEFSDHEPVYMKIKINHKIYQNEQ